LTEHWNGKTWSRVPSPNSPGAVVSVLSGVSCPSATTWFAVGYATTNASETRFSVLVERWNGKTWSMVSTPNPTGTTDQQLNSVSCPNAKTCFAVGAAGVERWDGTTWSIVPSVGVGLRSSVSCTNATSCLAVGDSAARWNGKTWSHVPTPTPGTSQLGEGFEMNGVSCTKATTCLAVGMDAVPLADFAALSERWNGKTWTLAGYGVWPNGDAYFNGVSCTNATNCIGVGASDASDFGVGPAARAFIDSWDGTTWSAVASPQFGDGNSWLAAVSCVSATNCYAVGYISEPYFRYTFTLIEHWDGTTWSKV